MPSTQPRISTVLEKPLYKTLEALAHRDGLSLSQKARDLLRQAIELEEDAELEALAESRRANRAPSVPLSQVKSRLKLK